MTVTDRIFQNVAELSVPNFFITVEFSVMGNEMPEHIESFVLEKYQAILHGANGRKFVYTEGGWRLFFTFFPTDKVVDEPPCCMTLAGTFSIHRGYPMSRRAPWKRKAF